MLVLAGRLVSVAFSYNARKLFLDFFLGYWLVCEWKISDCGLRFAYVADVFDNSIKGTKMVH